MVCLDYCRVVSVVAAAAVAAAAEPIGSKQIHLAARSAMHHEGSRADE